MASSSMKSLAKANLLGKRKPEDDLETKPFLRKHKQQETTKGFDDSLQLVKGRVKLLETKSGEANIISVKDSVEGPEETPDFVEDAAVRNKMLFAGSFDKQTKVSDIIDFFKDVAQVVGVRLILSLKGRHVGYGFVEFASADEATKALEKKNGEYLHKRKILMMKVHDETPDFVEESAVPRKTLFVGHFASHTEISDIIDFFKDVGQVAHVRLVAGHLGMHVGYGFVEFASANEAQKALEKKNGEYLHKRKIFLDVADKGATYLPRYCVDHKVWYEDNLPRESLPLKEDESPPKFAEEVLLVANLSPQTTEIVQIIDFFEDVGEVVGVRLFVNHEGKHAGYGFVEFSSAYEANKALEKKNGEYLHNHKILLMKGPDKTPDVDKVFAVRNKTLFVANLCFRYTEISDIIDFFKDVGEVVHVRLFVGRKGKHLGYGFVEFASADEAKEALEKKNGEYLHDREISLDIYRTALETQLPRYCIGHKVWYKDYLLGIEDDAAAVEGLDETPDFVEEAIRKKTVFVSNVSDYMKMRNIIQVLADVGEVVRARLFVDDRGTHLGCGLVEFAYAYEAKKAVEEKNRGHRICLHTAERARYAFRPKYKLVEKLWCEDNHRRESLAYKTQVIPEKQKEPPICKRIVFSDVD